MGRVEAKAALGATLGSSLALLLAHPAHADDANRDDLSEVVVTAQRRDERPQDVPMSLTAVSGAGLDSAQVATTADLGNVAPSLVMTRSGAFTQPYLRGVGKRSTLGVENSVATYVDGVYLASSISALQDLGDVARVEVLNGPQGTLFGRNTTGGVIQIVTRDPEPRTSGEVSLRAGSYDTYRGDAYLTGGTDELAANLAVSLSGNGGYGANAFTGRKDQGEIDHSLVARSKWVWRPAEALKLTLAGDYQDFDQDFSHRPLDGYAPIGGPRVQGSRDVDHDAPTRFHFKYGGVSLRADADLGGLKLVSLTAQRWMDAHYALDLDLGPEPLLSAAPVAHQEQFSQEFQLQSGEGSPVAWVAGLYYVHIREEYEPTNFEYGASYAARLGGRIEQVLSSLGKTSAFAAYAQATWPLGDRTRLTTGLRYADEERSVEARGQQLFGAAPFVRPIPGLPLLTEPPLKTDDRFNELTWRVALDHRLSETLMAYGAVSRGFQSGGWNLQTPQAAPFAPETLDAYEAGVKFADPATGISADASVFFYDYADLQVSTFTPLGSVTTNAASADIYGVDVQVKAPLGARTDITVGAQVLEAEFNSFRNATCVNYSQAAAVLYAPVACDVTGNRLPFAPEFKLNLAANHEVGLGDFGTLTLSANVAYSSGYYAEPDNVVEQDAFTTVDASVAWRLADNGLTVRLWALNLTDAEHFDVLSTFPTASVLYRPTAPRRFGVTATYAF